MSDGVRLELRDLIALRGAAHGLGLSAKQRTVSVQAGGYRSAYKGRGLDFDEVRVYQPTDDAHMIDWRVTARRGSPYTKVFCEERERPVLILVDLHPGMHFGTRKQFKSVLAGRLAALFAWAADRAGDRIGGVVASAAGHREILPAPRHAGVLPLLNTMVKLQPHGPAAMQPGRMDAALARLVRVARPGSLVVVLSDFREAGEAAARQIRTLSEHSSVIGGFLYDPLEASAPQSGIYRLGTPDRQVTLDSGRPHVTDQWQAAFEAHRAGVQKLFRRCSGHWMEISTADRILPALRKGLAAHAVQCRGGR